MIDLNVTLQCLVTVELNSEARTGAIDTSVSKNLLL